MGEATVTTGRQTAIVRKPGGAVTRKGAFPDSEGYKLDANESSFRCVFFRLSTLPFAIILHCS